MAVQGLPVPEPVLGVALSHGKGEPMIEGIPRSKSRKVYGYVRRVLALDATQQRRAERYDRYIRPLDAKRDALIAEVATRARALSGGQAAQAQCLLRESRGGS